MLYLVGRVITIIAWYIFIWKMGLAILRVNT
ncbi:hypothetical protein FHU10_3292 [Serratia fonticola]|uniref:Uncharacterized protein n=1 Tax=Serratia fonticola TaxID=47917 RepID=A0A559T7W7_SERFO|nr:hypothetical protein FHU09_4417 [Serratia fonticola]TQI96204.1 hypothetical protein FHU11_1631 [Serratia fonticola]TVZ70701.1 hypothetical protein FHU10_3292 [Serratia fonticola]